MNTKKYSIDVCHLDKYCSFVCTCKAVDKLNISAVGEFTSFKPAIILMVSNFYNRIMHLSQISQN